MVNMGIQHPSVLLPKGTFFFFGIFLDLFDTGRLVNLLPINEDGHQELPVVKISQYPFLPGIDGVKDDEGFGLIDLLIPQHDKIC